MVLGNNGLIDFSDTGVSYHLHRKSRNEYNKYSCWMSTFTSFFLAIVQTLPELIFKIFEKYSPKRL
jgi:hypothetical protein